MIRRWFILATLVIAMIGLLWNFYREVVVYHALDAVQKTIKPPQKSQESLPQYAKAWDNDILQMNLFVKERSYVPTAIVKQSDSAEQVAVPAPVLPVLNLNGIILDQYGEFVAFIQVDGGQPKRVRKGDMFSDILVLDISTREVKLLWNNEEMNLSMKKIQTVPRKK